MSTWQRIVQFGTVFDSCRLDWSGVTPELEYLTFKWGKTMINKDTVICTFCRIQVELSGNVQTHIRKNKIEVLIGH